jgi:glycosyltransferase involved in cell wall biosynthesis
VRKTITYVFPVYNNAPSLRPLYDEVRAVIAAMADRYDYELVFVDDGSRDDSGGVLRALAKEDDHVRVLTLSRNFGHQAAVTAGLDHARGDAVIIMDADLQDPPEVCRDLVAKWEEGYEVVYAQRRTRKDTLLKRVTAGLYYRMLAGLSSVDIPRDTGDFRLIDRAVVDVVKEMREYHRFLRGMYSFAGFRQAPVQFDRRARHAGKSEYTLKKLFNLAKDGVFGFSDVPLKLATRLGFFVSILSLVGILYAITVKLFFTLEVPGWTFTVVAIFFMGGVQLVMLGILGEYLGRVHDEVRHRPVYIVREKINTD